MSYFKEEIKPKIQELLCDIFNIDKYTFISIIIKYCKSETKEDINMTCETVYGIKHGYEIELWNNIGEICSKRLYINGQLHDKNINFYKNGNIRSIQYYKNNKRNGTSTFYDSEGIGLTRAIYKNDVLVEYLW